MSLKNDTEKVSQAEVSSINNGITASEYGSELESEKIFEQHEVDRSNAGSSWMAYFNVVCVVAGSGVLGLPMALKQGGWIGLVILFLAWAMSIYTSHLLIRCLYVTGNTRLTTYKEIATVAFGSVGGWVTFFFNAWILMGGPVLYLVLSGQNINQLCKGTAGEIGNIPWTIISCVIVVIPFVMVKTMKDVAWVSALGFVAISLVVLLVLILSLIDKPNQVDIHHDAVVWDMFPIALSTIAFSFGGNVVYPHIERSMKKPQSWNKVSIGGLSTCAILYLIVAVCGYSVYGDTVMNPIYNNLPPNAGQILAIVVITINVLTSAPIYTTSFSLDIEEMLNITVERFGKVKEFVIRATIRITIMAIITVIACTVPHFSALMSLIGAFGNCTLIFIFPVIFYLKLTGVRNKPFYELIWCFLVVLLGLVGLVFGSMESVKALIVAYN